MERSEYEKEMYKQLIGYKMDVLNYKLKEVKSEEYGTELVYIIPDEDKKQVLENLWPFVGIPSLNDVFIDIHEGRKFRLKDFIVVRFEDYNMIASPWYFGSGGTVLDFIKESDNGFHVEIVK